MKNKTILTGLLSLLGGVGAIYTICAFYQAEKRFKQECAQTLATYPHQLWTTKEDSVWILGKNRKTGTRDEMQVLVALSRIKKDLTSFSQVLNNCGCKHTPTKNAGAEALEEIENIERAIRAGKPYTVEKLDSKLDAIIEITHLGVACMGTTSLDQ